MHLERAYCVWSILWLYTAPFGLKLQRNDFVIVDDFIKLEEIGY